MSRTGPESRAGRYVVTNCYHDAMIRIQIQLDDELVSVAPGVHGHDGRTSHGAEGLVGESVEFPEWVSTHQHCPSSFALDDRNCPANLPQQP